MLSASLNKTFPDSLIIVVVFGVCGGGRGEGGVRSMIVVADPFLWGRIISTVIVF